MVGSCLGFWSGRDAPACSISRDYYGVSLFTEVYRQLPLPPHGEPRRHGGMITSGGSVQAALGSADARLLVRRSPPRPDFRQIAGMRADGPTPRKSRVRPAWISPAVHVPGGRHGAGAARPGMRAGSV